MQLGDLPEPAVRGGVRDPEHRRGGGGVVLDQVGQPLGFHAFVVTQEIQQAPPDLGERRQGDLLSEHRFANPLDQGPGSFGRVRAHVTTLLAAIS